jgi:hypothetical protein
MLVQSTETVSHPRDIARIQMTDVYIGVVNGLPFITDADEVYVFVDGLWYMEEWEDLVDAEGDVHRAVMLLAAKVAAGEASKGEISG